MKCQTKDTLTAYTARYRMKSEQNTPIVRTEGRMPVDNRERILETALDLFYARGYDAVGVQEIAEKSGVTKPTLYYYFKSKYGLLEQLLESRGEPFLKDLRQACVYRGDLKETLCAAVGAVSDFAGKDPKFAVLLVALFYSARDNESYRAVRPMMLRLQKDVESIFHAAAFDLGNMHGRQRQFSLGFIGLVILYLVMKYETGGRECIDISGDEIEALVHQFMHGIYS